MVLVNREVIIEDLVLKFFLGIFMGDLGGDPHLALFIWLKRV